MRTSLFAILASTLVLAACQTTGPTVDTSALPHSSLLSGDSDPEAIELLEKAGVDVSEIAQGLSEGTRIRVRVNHKEDGSDVEVESVTQNDDGDWQNDDELMRAIEATLRTANGDIGADLGITDEMLDIDASPVTSVQRENLNEATTTRSRAPRRQSQGSAPPRTQSSAPATPAPQAEGSADKEVALATGRNRVASELQDQDFFGASGVLGRSPDSANSSFHDDS